MNYIKIRNFDISNGPGISVSLFCSGCTHRCSGCFNPETHDFNAGKKFTDETLQYILDLCAPDYISHLALLGGEPLHPRNRETIAKLVTAFKEKYPDKTVWIWTGYLYEEVSDFLAELAGKVDVIVDGRFVESLKDLRLPYAGSSNQRVIDVKTSIMTGVITLYK